MINFQKFHMMMLCLNMDSDKPDLRNPLIINDITEIFTRDDVHLKFLKNL